jgi:endonuclease YncB( thermonuclease family)
MADVSFEIVDAVSDGGFSAKVTLADGSSLAAELVKGGMAWLDGTAGRETAALEKLENSAREGFLGLWAYPEDDTDTDWRKEILARRNLQGEKEDKTMAGLLTVNDRN